jgi:hypothetical protein
MATRQKTVDNYLRLLEAMSKRKQRINSVGKMLAKFRVSRGANKQLKEMGLVEELPTGGYKWVGGQPSDAIARELVTRINADVMEAVRAGKTSTKGHHQNPARQQHNIVGTTFHTVPTTVLSKLRKEREDHVNRIAKIDAVLTAAEELA